MLIINNTTDILKHNISGIKINRNPEGQDD